MSTEFLGHLLCSLTRIRNILLEWDLKKKQKCSGVVIYIVCITPVTAKSLSQRKGLSCSFPLKDRQIPDSINLL